MLDSGISPIFSDDLFTKIVSLPLVKVLLEPNSANLHLLQRNTCFAYQYR